jgi:hypothetical protein
VKKAKNPLELPHLFLQSRNSSPLVGAVHWLVVVFGTPLRKKVSLLNKKALT